MSISAEDAEELKRTALSDIQKEKELSLLKIQEVTQNAQGNIKATSDEILKEHVEKLKKECVASREIFSNDKVKNGKGLYLYLEDQY